MLEVTYEIVQHDGGWAYKVNGAFSEPFSTHAEALWHDLQRIFEWSLVLSPKMGDGRVG
jgi:hypothetical protein